MRQEPPYTQLFTELGRTHPWPQEPDALGDAMHALARARGASDGAANAYGDKARDWAIATWRDKRKEHRPLTIIDASGADWVWTRDREGQEWAIRGDVYEAMHRGAHERTMRAEGRRTMTLARMEELNRAFDARGLHTACTGIYPVVVDPETGERQILHAIFEDRLPPWPPRTAAPPPRRPAG